MKTFQSITFITITAFFILNPLNSKAQSEIETLEKMYQMVENDRSNEQKAQKAVLSYFTDLKNQVRDKSSRLTESEYNNLISRINITKNQYQESIRNYSGGYYEFYVNGGYEMLENFHDKTMDLLYKYIYN